MRLLVDLGNSRLKWAMSGAGAWQPAVLELRGAGLEEALTEVWGGLPAPRTVVAVSVAAAAAAAALERWVRARWGIATHWVRAQAEQLGVVNHYREPAALGADRWVALIGARAEFPDSACCVVDCGTAVTIDALAAQGDFLGGVILPGLTLSRSALLQGTAGIRVHDGSEVSCLARTTADAVAAGTLYALAGAIERICAEFEQALGQSMKLVVTGGDADRVAALLTRPARRAPDLILRGLERIAERL
ncbi:MAG TPA: type III pantothenate kinase [Burkholderiales bacterium]